MALALVTFKDLYGQVLRFLGCAQPTAAEIAVAREVVREGYARFLDGYDWSFLVKAAELKTQANVWYARLEYDFDRLEAPFCVGPDGGEPPLEERSYGEILHQRATFGGSGAPRLFALRQLEPSTTAGSVWQAVFWPTPAAALTYYYSYRFFPARLEQDSDIPVGAARYTAALKACCLAAAELHEDGQSGPEDNAARQRLAEAIIKDQTRAPDTLGTYINGVILPKRGRRPILYDND